MPEVFEYSWLSQIEQGEHSQQEFKFRIDSSREIAQTLCAFANTLGGVLWIGIKDNGKISGCNPEEEFHMISGAASLYCIPKIKLNVATIMLQGKYVLKCDVPSSIQRPHYVRVDHQKKLAFIRHNDFNIIAGRVILALMKQQLNLATKPEVFKPNEMILLTVLTDHLNCSISKLVRLTGFPIWRVENLLVRFIRWELVRLNISSQGVTYSLVTD